MGTQKWYVADISQWQWRIVRRAAGRGAGQITGRCEQIEGTGLRAATGLGESGRFCAILRLKVVDTEKFF